MCPRSRIDSYNESECSICGSKDWTGSWRGHKLILVCRKCAIEVLPALIADATWHDGWMAEKGRAYWANAEISYAYACTANLRALQRSIRSCRREAARARSNQGSKRNG
jgi:hypothetical protein